MERKRRGLGDWNSNQWPGRRPPTRRRSLRGDRAGRKLSGGGNCAPGKPVFYGACDEPESSTSLVAVVFIWEWGQWHPAGAGSRGQLAAPGELLRRWRGRLDEGWARLKRLRGQSIQVGFLLQSSDVDPNVYDGGIGWFVDEVALETGNPIFPNPEGFEDGLGDWFVSNGIWEVGTPTTGTYGAPNGAYKGTNCAGTVISGSRYPEANSSRLESPYFMVPAASQSPRLRWWQWFSFGGGDSGTLQVRVGGGSWEDLAIFSGNGGGVWTQAGQDLVDYAGQNIQVGFLIRSTDTDPNVYDGGIGWFVDEVALETGNPILSNPERFENGVGDWFVSNGSWQVGTTPSGTNCAGTVLSYAGYPEANASRLESPYFIVPAANQSPRLRWWQWFSFGGGDSAPCRCG